MEIGVEHRFTDKGEPDGLAAFDQLPYGRNEELCFSALDESLRGSHDIRGKDLDERYAAGLIC